MPKDENKDEDLEKKRKEEDVDLDEDEEEEDDESGEEKPEEDEEEDEDDDKGENFRGKLNATNRFLKKEGYEFDEKTGKWNKPQAKNEKSPKSAKDDSLSDKDIFALVKAGVDEEDIDEVKSYAKYRKIPISQALKDKTLKSILDERAEERTTANAINLKGARGVSKVTGEALIEKARRGEVPDSDEDIDKLVDARLGGK